MRIVAGKAKGRQLFTPKSQKVRPTGDRVKESLFNMIAPFIEDAIVFDLFAGTGNLGLEAVSRGAVKAYFSDNNKKSLEIVRKNIDITNADSYCYVIDSGYEQALKIIDEKIDVFFLDPPYNKGYIHNCINLILSYDRMADEGIIVIEHSPKEEMSEHYPNLELVKRKRYGITMISIFKYTQEKSSDI